jgi:hypothetical protein
LPLIALAGIAYVTSNASAAACILRTPQRRDLLERN